MYNLWVVAISVLFLNLPFGFWRAGVKKFSPPWFMAVHLPVPFVILIRALAGLECRITIFPILIITFTLGQLLGGKLRYLYQKVQ